MVNPTRHRPIIAIATTLLIAAGTFAANPTNEPKSSVKSSVSTSKLKSNAVISLADNGKKASPRNVVPVDRESENQAMELVQAHLPELDGMLKRLRANKSHEYDRAIRDLARSARRLEVVRARDGRLYDIEVELLKSRNEVNLLTAKLKVRDSKQGRGRLREAAARLQRAQLSRYTYDAELYRQRIKRAQKQLDVVEMRLEAIQTNSEEHLDKAYLGLLRKAGRDEQP